MLPNVLCVGVIVMQQSITRELDKNNNSIKCVCSRAIVPTLFAFLSSENTRKYNKTGDVLEKVAMEYFLLVWYQTSKDVGVPMSAAFLVLEFAGGIVWAPVPIDGRVPN